MTADTDKPEDGRERSVMDEKIFAFGDIHGCLDKFEALIANIEIDYGKDRLVFLGDYIDRGEKPCPVVEYIIHLKKKHHDQIICLMGNHEDLFIEYLIHGANEQIFLANGGLTTLKSFNSPSTMEDISKNHRLFFESLQLFYETQDYYFVHAGLRPGVPLHMQTRNDLLWIRDEFFTSSYNFEKTVVFGHTPFRHPFIEKNKIGIDTGAVYGGRLTCIELPTRKIYQS